MDGPSNPFPKRQLPRRLARSICLLCDGMFAYHSRIVHVRPTIRVSHEAVIFLCGAAEMPAQSRARPVLSTRSGLSYARPYCRRTSSPSPTVSSRRNGISRLSCTAPGRRDLHTAADGATVAHLRFGDPEQLCRTRHRVVRCSIDGGPRPEHLDRADADRLRQPIFLAEPVAQRVFLWREGTPVEQSANTHLPAIAMASARSLVYLGAPIGAAFPPFVGTAASIRS